MPPVIKRRSNGHRGDSLNHRSIQLRWNLWAHGFSDNTVSFSCDRWQAGKEGQERQSIGSSLSASRQIAHELIELPTVFIARQSL